LDLKNNSENNKEKIKKELKLFYRSLSERILKERTLIESKKMNLKVKAIKVRSYKNRWGSCSSNGDISYNWKLIMAPEKIIDYVIIHELCHLIHFNHSRDYWEEVSKKIPNYKECREWLKSNQYLFNW
jgi:predicted metal-dependent hydrolase